MHQSTTPSLSQTIWPRWASRQFPTLLIIQTLLPVTFGYSLSSEAVVMRQLRRWKRLWRRSLTRSHMRTSMGLSSSCWNGTRSTLQPEEIKVLKLIEWSLYYVHFRTNTLGKGHHHHHPHHHLMPQARVSPSLSRHFSLSFIASGRSSGQHPVSSHSCWIYVRAGRPAFARPCVGVHRSTSLMSSSLLLSQCPACCFV